MTAKTAVRRAEPADAPTERETAEGQLSAAESAAAAALAEADAARTRVAELDDAERRQALEAIAAEIAASDPGGVREDLEMIASAMARILVATKERDKRVAAWVHRLQALGVEQAGWRGHPEGVTGWRSGQGGLAIFVPGRVHAVRQLAPGTLAAGALARACTLAGLHPGAVAGADAPKDFASDPDRWLADRW
jgi:hypothetical protein